MTIFRYRAVTGSGDMVEGQMEAPDRAVVVEKLRDQGNFPLNVDEGPGRAESILHRDLFGTGSISQRDLAISTRELATLLQAGLPLDRALRVLIDIAEAPLIRDLLTRVLERVQGGMTLSDALDADQQKFPRYYSGMVRAGEAGGSLYDVLGRLADFMERIRALRSTVTSALIYPAILLAMAGATMIVMFTVVLPQFRPMFESMGTDVPLLTRMFLATGDAIASWWWAAALAVALAGAFFGLRLRDPSFRRRWDGFKLRVPLFGGLLRKVETARFAHTMAMLLRGGQPLPDALGIVRNVIGNTAIRAAVGDISGHLRQGRGLSTPMAETGMFPTLAVHLIRVGEEGGKLEAMMERLSDIYDGEVRDTTQRLISLLVPVMTICLGGVIAIIIVSILGAIFSANEIIS